MPKTAYVQPFSGASGDMLLGALVDAGLSPETLADGLSSLGVKGWRLEIRRVLRGPPQHLLVLAPLRPFPLVPPPRRRGSLPSRILIHPWRSSPWDCRRLGLSQMVFRTQLGDGAACLVVL